MSKIQSKEISEFITKNLTAKFFKSNVPSKVTPYSILETTLLIAPSELLGDKVIGAMTQEKKDEFSSEIKLVEEENDIEQLYKMLRKPLNPVASNILAGKLLAKENEIMPRAVEDLKRSGNDYFVETVARMLVMSENDFSENVAQILPNIKYPYTQAMASFILGKIGKEENIETVYNSFQTLKNNYTDEKYYEGPLLGIYELKRRYEF